MQRSFWKFIKHPEVITGIVVIISTLVLNILDIFSDMINVNIQLQIILIVLACIIALLLVFHKSLIQLKEKQLENLNIDMLFRSFKEISDEIKDCISTSEEIWLLSRTGQGWLGKYRDEFDTVFKKTGTHRFLLLDPEGQAIEMAGNAAKPEWMIDNSAIRFQKENAIYFLNWLNNNYKGKIDLKVIDYLAAWALLFINPNKKDKKSTIFVELATFHPGTEDRPVFKVKWHDFEYFERFFNEFNQMWQTARPWKNEE